MKVYKYIPFILLLLFLFNLSFSQQKEVKGNKEEKGNVKIEQKQISVESTLPGLDMSNEADFKVIASTSSYIEIEYYPAFQPIQKVSYNGQTYSIASLINEVDRGPKFAGQPDIRFRVFPLIFPSEKNNTVTIVEVESNEATNIDLAPIPNIRLRNPNVPSFDNIDLVYDKDSKIYSQNKFMPDKIADVNVNGSVRENLFGNLIINPYQYNPVTKVLRQYTRIRVRVNYGQSPVMLNRVRSLNERELLKNISINSDIASNWMNPALLQQRTTARLNNSVMSTGDFYKIEIKDNGSGTSDGIYKITKSFLESAGINLNNIDPRTIKMYGNGGDMLSSSLTAPRPQDLQQIQIYIEGEADGHFDANDYILFYGKSVNNWSYDSANQKYSHFVDVYSTSNYYWIQLGTPGYGERMQLLPSENIQNPLTPFTFREKIFYEPEILNLIFEGNVWLSETKRGGQTFQWNNTLTGLADNSDILYRIKPASRVMCGYSNEMDIREEKSTMSSIYFPMGCVIPGYGDWIWTGTYDFTINSSIKTNGEESSFSALFNTNSAEGEGYLDWMEIQYLRKLNSVKDDFIRIVSNDVNPGVLYNVSSFSGNQIKIFDATNHNQVNLVQPMENPSTGIKFERPQTDNETKYFVVGPNGFKTPTSISQKIPNQNLHGITDGASFIIITHKDLMAAAERLKAKREAPGPGNPNYLKTVIVDVQTIYNEFSGGVLDAVAIRDFLKYCYDTWQEKPVYVCFFGDGSFDYRNILTSEVNYVPSYEFTDPNINQVNGFTSDDFYVMIVGNDSAPDIAHGRIPAGSLEEANGYMDKVDCYEDQNNNGYWKNTAIFVADDGRTTSGNDGSQHTDQCEILAEDHFPEWIDKVKLYLVNYPAVITSAGRRKPGVNKDIVKFWNEGAVAFNYTGHGSPDVWAHEVVLEKDVIVSQLNNVCKYPFLTVASCDFSKFDNPVNSSGGELLAMAQRRGAIGTLAATRPVYGSQNSIFNNTFWTDLVQQTDTLLLQKRFGQAAFLTKQVWNGINDLKFILLCDPTARIQAPRFRSRVDSISGLSNDTMRALSKIKIYGSVMHPDSTLWQEYNGKIFLKIFDVTKQIVVHDEDNFEFRFKLPGGIIYSGTQNVSGGRWAVEFIVPKDISYLNQHGKLINYFYNNQADGASLYKNFIVGGINTSAAMDTTGPDIKLFINDRNFRSGDIVNQNFKLLGDLFDESGINTTGTIGHKLEAILDDQDNSRFDLTNFYNSDTTYKSGHFSYDFSSINEGKHSIRVKAWDTYNNSSEVKIDFTVASNSALQVTNVYNFPNPFKGHTAFTFQHNFPDPINVSIKIYTVAGRLIKEIKQSGITDKFVVINWTGTDADGENLGNGVYIYKLVVDADGTSVTNTGKLAVLK